MAGMIFGQFILTGYLIPHGMTQKGSETSFFFSSMQQNCVQKQTKITLLHI